MYFDRVSNTCLIWGICSITCQLFINIIIPLTLTISNNDYGIITRFSFTDIKITHVVALQS